MRLSLAILCLGMTAVSAQAFQFGRETVRVTVVPMSPTEFEVLESVNVGGPQMWCAAGLYAKQAFGKDVKQLYVARARGPSERLAGRKSVVFSTEPVPSAFTDLSLGVRRTGKTLTSLHARSACDDTFRVNLRIGTI
jgi:hypothetical protein